jgi:hypothetical protein
VGPDGTPLMRDRRDVTMIVRGAVDPQNHALNVAPTLEETWRVLP